MSKFAIAFHEADGESLTLALRPELRAVPSAINWSGRGCHRFERQHRPQGLVPEKAASFPEKWVGFEPEIASSPRRYVAGKIFKWGLAGLWMTAAALQRLAF